MLQCRLVRQDKDQCAYISKHCPDEDAGFYSYLSLFYCSLSNAKPVAFMILVSWLGLLFSTIGIAASDFFCINLSTIATILGMSESLAGVTLLAFGNGSPDVFSTFAAFSTNSSSLAIGELFGAACFITAVVAGAMGVVRPFKVARKAFMRDIAFFTVAALFSLGFLWDGRLHVWECLAMVGFYVFYVAFVVCWHWYFTRRKSRQERLAAAREQYIIHVTDEDPEEYHDNTENEEDGADDGAGTRHPLSRGTSTESFSLLEAGNVTPGGATDGDSDEDDEERDRFMATLQSNMHLNRPGPGSRRNTLTPIRPSLVGALEYRALVSNLQKSRSQQRIPMHTRRHSDDPSRATDADNLSTISDPPSRPPYYLSSPQNGTSPVLLARPAPEIRGTASGRSRAVSANDAASLKPDPSFIESHATQTRQFLDVSTDDQGRLRPPSSVRSMPLDKTVESPDLLGASVDPGFNTDPFRGGSLTALLAPPVVGAVASKIISPPRSPCSRSPRPSPGMLPKIQIPNDGKQSPRISEPPSPFPTYYDDLSTQTNLPANIYLPPPSISTSSHPCILGEDGFDNKPLKWWPHAYLPPPKVLWYGLFPTFRHWDLKSWWERALAIVAAPSILLLTVTLPVVDSERDESHPVGSGLVEPVSVLEPYTDHPSSSPTKSMLSPSSPAITLEVHDEPNSAVDGPGQGSAAVAVNLEQSLVNAPAIRQLATPSTPAFPTGPQPWNRWLTITQLFLAPLFMVAVIYTQYMDPPDSFRPLIKPICFSLLFSLLLLIPLLLTTTPTHRPKPYETILSLAGFTVAIGWISTIASQVVAVLKALAVILNMSHAVMGLTIFAVGNSLGDLVADITVAKLGFPVMALSACFGGPMLNILLGIGLSGSWILIRGAQHRHHKHPGKEIKYRSYDIDVGTTLMISGVTLVFTLFVLAVAVPLNNWTMSKKLGWGLIALWSISTLGNVLVVEILGVGQEQGGEALIWFSQIMGSRT